MRPFNEVWREIQDRLAEGTEVQNWSVLHGLTGKMTYIGKVYYDFIDVIGQRGAKPLIVKRTDFKEVYETVWDGYKAAKFTRTEMGKVSRKTTYIFSILHWVEEQIGSTTASASWPASTHGACG